MKTHRERILAILKSGGSITQLEATRWEDPCLRLGARICDLRNGVHDGTKYDIEELKEKNADGKGYHARYRMRIQAPILPPAFEPKPEPKVDQTNCYSHFNDSLQCDDRVRA